MVKVIVDDRGHGGKDPGAVGNDLQEKQVVSLISKYFQEYLNEHYTGFKIISTRTTDKLSFFLPRFLMSYFFSRGTTFS